MISSPIHALMGPSVASKGLHLLITIDHDFDHWPGAETNAACKPNGLNGYGGRCRDRTCDLLLVRQAL
jgi:hypothetical protein